MFRISIALCCRFHYNKLYLYTLLKVKESQTMRVTFYTLGCKVNQNETGALAQLFEENGYTVVANEEVAAPRQARESRCRDGADRVLPAGIPRGGRHDC